MRDISTKAYAQWVVIRIVNSSQVPVTIKNVALPWGKFYKDGKSPVSYALCHRASRRILTTMPV
jgi:hypothetical protein